MAAAASLLALPSAAVISVATVGTLIALAAGVMGQTWAQERVRWYGGVTRASVHPQTGIFEEELQKVRAAAIRSEADYTLETIRANLSEPAKEFFAPLLAIKASAKTIASGPTYGSTGHAILLGIRAGVLSLKSDEGQALLCELLNAQATAAQAPDDRALRKFQQDERLHNALRALEAHLVYRPGVSELIFRGNVCHGPLSWEKDVDFRIRERMAACGVIYLRGNTDAHRGLHYRDETGAATIEPSAEYAPNTLTYAQWQAHDKIFRNHWDSPATGEKFSPIEGVGGAEGTTEALSRQQKMDLIGQSKSLWGELLYSLEGLPVHPRHGTGWDTKNTEKTFTHPPRWEHFLNYMEGEPLKNIWWQPDTNPLSLFPRPPQGEWVSLETHKRPTFGASWAELKARGDGITSGHARPYANVYPSSDDHPVCTYQNYA